MSKISRTLRSMSGSNTRSDEKRKPLDGEPNFFSNEESFREWLIANHESESELWAGFYKIGSAIPSMTWSQSVDQALCFGWIDGLRRGIDETSYKIRFTPRKKNSHWSAVNIDKMKVLVAKKLLYPAGIKAFSERTEANSRNASHEKQSDEAKLDKDYEARLEQFPSAWTYYNSTTATYQKASAWWVMKAKREVTRLRRLDTLIESCCQGLKIPSMR